MKEENKRYDYNLGCWVMDISPHTSPGIRRYDAMTGTWIDVDNSVDYEVASCEVPVTVIKGPPPSMNAHTSLVKAPPYKYEHPVSPVHSPAQRDWKNHKYDPANPWEGLDRHRYPATWHLLLKMHFESSWWKDGVYVSDDEYRDRVLRGIYKKEVRYPQYNRSDWENYE